MLHGAYPERHEILRYAQNDKKQKVRNDRQLVGGKPRPYERRHNCSGGVYPRLNPSWGLQACQCQSNLKDRTK